MFNTCDFTTEQLINELAIRIRVQPENDNLFDDCHGPDLKTVCDALNEIIDFD